MVKVWQSGCFGLVVGLLAWGSGWPAAIAETSPGVRVLCTFNPALGKPNPLGMRAFVTAAEMINGDTTFKYEQFPAPVPGSGNPPMTLAQQRELTFYKTKIDAARQLLLDNPKYYQELLGFQDPDGFAAMNAVLVCKSVTVVPRPPTAPSRPPISELPDGNYRFWSGIPTVTQISDEELLKQGGIVFLFRKTGDRILGALSQIDAEAGVCIEGVVNGNTVSGFATSFTPRKDVYTGDEFKTWGVPDGSLQVRRGEVVADNLVKYTSSLLNLATYNRINVGQVQPPKQCPGE
jgi:hypothetical protein